MGKFNSGKKFSGGNFKRTSFSGGNNFGGGGNFSKPRFNRDRSESTEMFDAVCSNCKKDCQVPFRPSGNKPVLCKSCFQKERGQDDNGAFRSERRLDRGERPKFSTDRKMGSSSYGPDFEKPVSSPNQYKKDFEALNAKLDKILNMVSKMQYTAPSSSVKQNVEAEVPLMEIIEEIAPLVEKKEKKAKAPAKAKVKTTKKKGSSPVKV